MIDDLAIWKRCLAPQEINKLFDEGQKGLSLGELLRQPTPLIQLVSVNTTLSGTLDIRFRNMGPWQNFRLWQANSLSEPFSENLTQIPEALGSNEYRFSYPAVSNAAQYFRIEGH